MSLQLNINSFTPLKQAFCWIFTTLFEFELLTSFVHLQMNYVQFNFHLLTSIGWRNHRKKMFPHQFTNWNHSEIPRSCDNMRVPTKLYKCFLHPLVNSKFWYPLCMLSWIKQKILETIKLAFLLWSAVTTVTRSWGRLIRCLCTQRFWDVCTTQLKWPCIYKLLAGHLVATYLIHLRAHVELPVQTL